MTYLWLLILCSIVAVVRTAPDAVSRKLVLSNDDGWAALTIREQFDALTKAGFDVILSAPALDKSGTGSSSATATVVANGCEYDTCPSGSPPTGFNASNPHLNYVNAFPADAVRFGIQTLAPEFFDSEPDFVVSGPNVGNNLGSTVLIAGTVGASTEAAKEGVPSVAFSAANCSQVSDFKFVFSRIFVNESQTDVEHCGSDHLPDETTVVAASGGCFASVSVMNATTKGDVDATTQRFVLDKLDGLLSCLP
ncbi:acid phosphatase [Punctularia strigosozonata HHB-11173 SS5]|uniref:acid phosphatase n=1 Tax=Punctularia strigosozonata (strain HHB-11173) TaxID=741275 RepID=UPI0004417072|nr:acid phosphatase [Punctularia strigosozonata HHB-11173 SS5]EIN05783.1 acid phosphatase [Punctularia strigosozonata HHB-11173 SS5]